MNHLRQAIPHEQVQQIIDDMLITMGNEEEGFCNGNYYTLQDAKKQLHALLTKFMMNKSECSINKARERAERGLAELKEMKSQVDNCKGIASTKKAMEDEQQEKETSQSDKEEIFNDGIK